MRFFPRATGLASALGMAVLLSGCAAYESTTTTLGRGTSSAFEGLANLGATAAPWGGTRPTSLGDSLTVQRVQGATASAEPLLPEEGNVWPAPEAPRATLMNPDQALRGITTYSPNVSDQPAPSAGERPAPPAEQPPERPRSQRRGAGGPFVPAPTAAMPEAPQPQVTLPPLAPLPPLPSRAPGGQPVLTPQGALTPSTTSGNTSTFNSPTGGGTITRDGNTSIINRPGEAPQIIQNPR